MPIEVETKLRVPDEHALERLMSDPELLALQMDEPRKIQMEAVYFDTPKDVLHERKWTLRIRKENGKSVAVFKNMGTIEDTVFSREEICCEAEQLDEALEKLVALGAPSQLFDLRPFVRRCRIEFVRTACSLRLEDGTICEFALDAGKIYADEKEASLLELELELLCGHPETMAALAQRLETKHNLSKELYSKYARVLRLLRSR